jgi:hypothetical protein
MAWPTKRAVLRYWRPFRVVAGFALLGVACWVVAGKSTELSDAGAFLNQIRWEWLLLAAVAELFSFLAMASLQRVMLVAGGIRARLDRVTLITFAGNSIQSALPIGAAFAGLYQFRQYELMGADEVLAGWAVIGTGAVSFSMLAALAGLGLAMAASTGSAFDLVEAILGVVLLSALAVIAWARRVQLYRLVHALVVMSEKRLHKPEGQWSGPLGRGLERMRTVAPTRTQWAQALEAGAMVWLADCGCLAFSFIAVGAGVPWQGLLLAYCGGQLAVNLPITPGGLGVVEGSLTVALVAFGGGQAATVAAVLLYRMISFWLPIPVGGGCYLQLLRLRRRAERYRAANAALLARARQAPPDLDGASSEANGGPVAPGREGGADHWAGDDIARGDPGRKDG